jgi:hypothetical protein
MVFPVMTRKKQIETAVLVVLLAVIALVIYYYDAAPSYQAAAVAADTQYQPIAVENPSLRLDLLNRSTKLDYTGRHRNIFSEEVPPPEPTPEQLKEAERRRFVGPEQPPPPPPLVVDVKFYGYVDDRVSGKRRAFFTNGDDVFIAAQGDTIENRFRVARIGNDSADLEEISSGRRATLVMEQPPEQAQMPPENPEGPQGIVR